MFSKVLWPLNLQEPQGRLDGVLDMLASLSAGHVHLLHVAEERLDNEARSGEKFDTLRNRLRERGFEVETAFTTGHVPTAICGFAEKHDANLVIMPWKPKSSMRIALLGSIVRDVVRLSERPVAVWKSKSFSWESRAEGLENVMYATAFQAVDNDVIPYLSDKTMNAAELVILHVGERAPDPAAEERRLKQVRENLDRLAGECSLRYNRIETVSALGRPAHQIVKQARSGKTDLVVVGKLDKPDAFGSMLGSTAEQLVRKSPCSLLVIPRGAARFAASRKHSKED